jgi:hypothetical protein
MYKDMILEDSVSTHFILLFKLILSFPYKLAPYLFKWNNPLSEILSELANINNDFAKSVP